MKQTRSFWDKFWRDSHGKIVLIQPANAPIIGWAVLSVLSKIMSPGGLRSTVEFIAFGCLLIWASLEVVSGVNYFRRTFGFLILFFSIYMRLI